MGGDNMLVSLLPWLIISIPFAIGNYFLAARLGKSRVLWVVLSLIPIFNVFFLWYIAYVFAIRILDRLDAIAVRLGVESEHHA